MFRFLQLYSAPGKAPPNVHVQSLKDNSILVMWDPLPEKYANGKLKGYMIFTRSYKREYEWHDDGELGQILNVSLSDTHVILSGLDGGRRYQISVAPVTVDVGPRSEWTTIMVGKCALILFVCQQRHLFTKESRTGA